MSEIPSTPGLSIESTIPLGWVPEPAMTAAGRESHRNTNIALLRALAALESQGTEYEHEKQEAVQKALEHVESKLDLMLLMVAGLIRAGASLPPEKHMMLYGDHVVWHEHAENFPQVGQRLMLSLYLSSRLPQPLHMSATVTSVETLVAETRISAAFDAQDEEFSEWLTRTIFRYHRRALHARRQP